MFELPLILPFIFLLGLAVGSFLNVLIDRLPNDESIMGRSHCDHCKKTLGGRDLIPILSYVALRGRCRYCHKKLSLLYPFVEVLTGTLFVLTWLFLGNTGLEKIIYIAMTATFIVIFFADLKYKIIPDSMQAALLILTFILHVVPTILLSSPLSSRIHFGIFYVVRDDVIAGLLVMVPILFLFLFTKGKGMGFGDVKFAFIMGFLLGWPAGFSALYVAFVLGGIVGAYLLVTGKKKLKMTIAFGPFLVLGTMVLLLAKEQILTFIHNLYI